MWAAAMTIDMKMNDKLLHKGLHPSFNWISLPIVYYTFYINAI